MSYNQEDLEERLGINFDELAEKCKNLCLTGCRPLEVLQYSVFSLLKSATRAESPSNYKILYDLAQTVLEPDSMVWLIKDSPNSLTMYGDWYDDNGDRVDMLDFLGK